MRIVCIMEAPLGSHKAHAINVVKTSGGFSVLGHEVILIARESEGPGIEPVAILENYGERDLHPLTIKANMAKSDSEFAQYAASMTRELMPDFVYARSFGAALACCDLGIPTVMETHAHAGDLRPIVLEAFSAATQGRLAAIITISHTLKAAYISAGAPGEHVHIVPDGVDPKLFVPPETDALRGPSPYETSYEFHAAYAGHLYDYKGIPCIMDAAKQCPHIGFHLIGGLPEDIARTRQTLLERSLHNVELHGMVHHAQVPRYLWHADALLVPYSMNHPSAAWTSPVKLGEYIASGTPIIASRIPGLEAWVDEPVVQWVTADDPNSLAQALNELAGKLSIERNDTTRMAACRELTHRFSYAKRAESILAAGLLRPQIVAA